MSINRCPDGRPNKLSLVAIDIITGLYGFQAVSAALFARAVRGIGGRHIQMSLIECAAAFLAPKIIDRQLAGGAPPRDLFAPVGTFTTKDGLINITTMRESQFLTFCRAIERTDLAADPSFATNARRLAHLGAFTDTVNAILAERTTAEWEDRFQAFGIMHARVNDLGAFLSHPQVTASDIFTWMDHPAAGRVPLAGVPGLANADPGRLVAPRLGEHSRLVLEELGWEAAAIDRLVGDGVIALSPATTAAAASEPGATQ